MNIAEFLLLLFAANLGIAFGAGLYETRIVLPLWFHKAANGNYLVSFDAMRTTDVGKKFWCFVTTLPLTLLTIVNLIFAIQSGGALHGWWLAASVVTLVERIGTFTFFIPTAIKLQKGENFSASKTTSLVLWWTRLNYIRNTLTLAALFISLKAILTI